MSRRLNLSFLSFPLVFGLALPTQGTWAETAIPVAEASPIPPIVAEVAPSPNLALPIASVEPAPKPKLSPVPVPLALAEQAPQTEAAPASVPVPPSAPVSAEPEASPSPIKTPAASTPRKDLLKTLRLIPVSAAPRSVVIDPSAERFESRDAPEPGLGLRLAAMLQKPQSSKKISRPEPALNPASSIEQGVAIEISPPPTRPKPNSGPVPAKVAPVSRPAFVVHFGSHFRQDQAVADRDELASVGVQARVYPAPGYYNVEYRVVSSPFASEAEAQRCLADVKKKSKGFRDATIGQDSAHP